VPSFDSADPTQPLQSIFSDDQIEFLRENVDDYDINHLLDQSLKDLMTSDDDPSVTDLMQAATDHGDSGDDEPPNGPSPFGGV
jgi:hypothetical protein